MRPFRPGNFFKEVAHKVEHEVKHIDHGAKKVGQKITHAAAGLERQAKNVGQKITHTAADLERQAKIDEFLLPVKNSKLAHSPGYARLRALLEYRSKHGQDPQEFVHEMGQQTNKVMQECKHELAYAAGLLRAMRRGNNIQRAKQEVYYPLQAGSISAAEAWRRTKSITGFQSTSAPSPGTTVGFGFGAGGSAVIGAAGCLEVIGVYTSCPGIYYGGDVSLGLQIGVNLDFVVEIGFVTPDNFGGPFVGIGIGGAFDIGGIFEVAWSIPQPTFPNAPLIPQGFTIGIGIGEEIEVAACLGDGWVRLVPASVGSPAPGTLVA
jgi:hypothetical protein